jgi:hypothetical protein
MAERAPQLLDFEERRLWESIWATPDLWDEPPPRRGRQHLHKHTLKSNWAEIKEFVQKHSDEATVPAIPDKHTCPF